MFMQHPNIQEALATLRALRARQRAEASMLNEVQNMGTIHNFVGKNFNLLLREHVAWPAAVSRIFTSKISKKRTKRVAFKDIGAMEKCGCQEQCYPDECINSKLSIFCSPKNCSLGGVCGNSFEREADGLTLFRSRVGIGMPKSRGYKNYSKDEISLLLAILEELLPVCTAEWINAVELYASRKERSWGDRTMASLRRKFVGLWSVSYPSSSFPALRAQARRIKGQIDNLQSSRIARSRSIPSRKLQSISSAPEQENHEQVRPDRRRLPGRSASFRVNVPEMLQDGPSFFGYSTALVGSNHGNDVVVDKATVRTTRDPGVGSIRYDPSFPSHPSPTVPNVPSLMPFVSKPRPDIRVTRTAIMKLYNQMIQLVVKAQVDAERREVERGDRERLERISALQYKNQLMAMITALHRPMQS